tara:strand:+ start:1767 stop:1955 length:189 start_codon:yes stop_codon:yes gene_type:complete
MLFGCQLSMFNKQLAITKKWWGLKVRIAFKRMQDGRYKISEVLCFQIGVKSQVKQDIPIQES